MELGGGRADEMTFTVIDRKGTRVRPVCRYCRKATKEGEHVNPRARKDKGWICFECERSVMEETLEKHQAQLDAGWANEDRYIEVPIGFILVTSDRWIGEMRLAISAQTPTLPAPLKCNLGASK